MISRSPPWAHLYVLFGPIITTEAHIAFSGARIHSNNTAEMTAMFEALSFLSPRGPVTHMMNSHVFIMILCMMPVFVWARSRPAHMCSWRSHVNNL